MSWHGIRYSLRLLNEKARSRGGGNHQCCGLVSKLLASGPMRTISPYRSGRSPDWLKMKNPAAAAVTREGEEDWSKRR
jgi:ATP-dependent DNA ligase